MKSDEPFFHGKMTLTVDVNGFRVYLRNGCGEPELVVPHSKRSAGENRKLASSEDVEGTSEWRAAYAAMALDHSHECISSIRSVVGKMAGGKAHIAYSACRELETFLSNARKRLKVKN